MLLQLLGAGTAVATVALALLTRLPGVQRLDDAIERFAGTHRALAEPFARIGTLPGERFVHPVIGTLSAVAIILLRPDGAARRAILPLAAASIGAILAHHAVKLVYRRPRPAIALSRGKTEPAFPSGHTADATAVVLTSAFLLAQHGLLHAAVALPLAIAIAFVTGTSRVALGWHWATDVLGGWLAGTAVAAGCCVLYGMMG